MLYYEESGTGKTLVFLHGFLESRKIWNRLKIHLEESFHIITLDLPGHGKSCNLREVNTMENMAEDVVEVLDELSIKRATFIGHSMGGYVTSALVDLFPNRVENIVLLNSSVLPDDEIKKEQRLKTCEIARKNFKLLVDLSLPNLFSPQNLIRFNKDLDNLKEIAINTDIEGVCSALKGMRERPNRSSILYDFKGDIHIIVGMNDKTVNPELFLELIPEYPNIALYKFDGGHVAFIEHYDEILNILKSI